MDTQDRDVKERLQQLGFTVREVPQRPSLYEVGLPETLSLEIIPEASAIEAYVRNSDGKIVVHLHPDFTTVWGALLDRTT
jgi:hypothetical protein